MHTYHRPSRREVPTALSRARDPSRASRGCVKNHDDARARIARAIAARSRGATRERDAIARASPAATERIRETDDANSRNADARRDGRDGGRRERTNDRRARERR